MIKPFLQLLVVMLAAMFYSPLAAAADPTPPNRPAYVADCVSCHNPTDNSGVPPNPAAAATVAAIRRNCQSSRTRATMLGHAGVVASKSNLLAWGWTYGYKDDPHIA